MRELQRSVVMQQKLSQHAKLSVFNLFFVSMIPGLLQKESDNKLKLLRIQRL